MKKCIEHDAALQIVFDACAECMSTCEEFDGIYADCHQCPLESVKLKLRDLPAADVLPRDEAIKMGAELAAMHGSDAASQQLEEAYLKGVEYGMTRRDVRTVVKATWIVKEVQALFPGMDEHPVFVCSECGYQIYDLLDNLKERHHFCPNCGARMEES